MFWLIKKAFNALLRFTGSLVSKCVSLSNKPCLATPTLINLNGIKLYYYPFIISLDKFNGRFNVVDDLSTKICAPSRIKDVNIKVFNMIKIINEAKTLVKHIFCDWKYKFNSTKFNSNQKFDIVINVNASVKSIVRAKTYYSCSPSPSTCICENYSQVFKKCY